MKSLVKTFALALMLANGISCQQMPDDSLEEIRMVSLSITARTFDSHEIGQWEEGGGNDFTLGGKESRSGEESVKKIAFAILDKNGKKVVEMTLLWEAKSRDRVKNPSKKSHLLYLIKTGTKFYCRKRVKQNQGTQT